MLKCFYIGSALCLAALTASPQSAYKPLYARRWKMVDDNIASHWDGQLSHSNDLPNVYITAWPQLPFMFYWDTYFVNLGLTLHNFGAVAKWNTQNILFAVDKYGYMGNAAVTTWGMARSQPPYLSVMVRDVFENSGSTDTTFLRSAYYTLKREYHFWIDTSAHAIEQHKTSIKGLQHYYQHATDKELIELYGQLASRFSFPANVSDAEKIKIAKPYAAEAETGMDFTPRFENRCPDFIAVDLNCLLYTYEQNFAWMVKILHLKNEPDWVDMSANRKMLINKYCWNEKRGIYLDYDFINKRSSRVASAITFLPLWAGIASPQQTKSVRAHIGLFETNWGIITTEPGHADKKYQWGETSVWPPIQLLVVKGLANYGFKQDAKRIAAKYLDLVTKNYLYPVPAVYKKDGHTVSRAIGVTYEKYNNNGTINDDEYPASNMMSWTAATFSWCYHYYLHN